MTDPSRESGAGRTPGRWAIRTAVAGDAERLAGFAARQFHAAYAADNSPSDMAEYSAQNFTGSRFASLIADESTTILVAESAGEAIAYAVAHHTAAPPAAVGASPATELARLYVDAAWHGAGLAAAMLAEVDRVAAGWNTPVLWLSVWTQNPRAIRFYRKHGFEIVGSREFRLGSDLQEDHLMTRAVAPPGPAVG